MPASRASSLFPDHTTPAASANDWATAYCDGGSRGNPGPAGYGAVLRAADGTLLAELGEFLGVCSNNVAEYRGLIGCLDWALTHNVRRLRVTSDSKLMVEQVNGRWAMKSADLKPLLERARAAIRRLDGFELTHALRHKNKDADRLANEAMDRGMGRTASTGSVAAGTSSTNTASTSNAAITRHAISTSNAAAEASTAAASGTMRRGFVRNGRIELLGAEPLPDGIFVKIVVE